jgi:hypothetical protein
VIQADGYRLKKQLVSGVHTEVYAAERIEDARPVVLKCYANDGEGTGRAAREFECLRKAAGPGVPAVLEVLAGRPPIVVLEQVSGVVLLHWERSAPPLADKLEVARQLASTLGRIHEARLIHRDLGPSNILVDPATCATHIVDFGSALPFGTSQRGETRTARSQQRGGQLAYVAPEQTGRMGRGIDSRSDLYSLGATLYLLLTGRPPFEPSDPLALIHAHLARVPASPHGVVPDVPVAISRMVMKLLEKEPEQRYQTGHALALDLEQCRGFLARGERIPDDLALGSADAPTRPVFRKRLYGREAQFATLLQSYERARAGRAEVALLRGAPGSGKSSLVDAIRTSVAGAGGYVAAGKFDPYRGDSPHSGLQTALGSLVDQMLCESEQRLEGWRQTLRNALGSLTDVVLELVPDFAPVLGSAEKSRPLAAKEATRRLALGVERLLCACAAPDHPLVLVLDDLQWAGGESLDVLEHVFAATRRSPLLIVGCYRGDDPGAIDGVRARLARLGDDAPPLVEVEMPPLSLDEAAELVADALGQPVEATLGLTRQIVARTDRHPLQIREFILHLHTLGHIRAQPPGRWTWDEAAIASAELPDGVVGLLIAKLGLLTPELATMLEFLSCIGDEFAPGELAELCDRVPEVLERELFALADEGLIVPSARGVRFTHDRIREAAQLRLSEERRSEIHHRIGTHLLGRTPPERLAGRALEIGEHLRRGAAKLRPEQRELALRVHRSAGDQALARGVASAAATYFRCAQALFEEADWQRDQEGAFALFLGHAEAALQSEAYPEALASAELLQTRAASHAQSIQAREKLIRILARCDDQRAIDVTLESLRPYGIRWTRRSSRWRARLAVRWVDWCLRGPLDERTFRPPRTDDLRWIEPHRFLTEAAPAMFRTRTQLTVLSIVHSLQTMRRNGAHRSPALALAGFAASRVEVLGRWRGLERYVAAVLGWIERRNDAINPRARCSLEVFSLPWLQTRRELAKRLAETAAALEELGDGTYAALATQSRICALTAAGTPLRDLEKQLAEARRTEHLIAMRPFFALHSEVVSLLRSERPEQIAWAALFEKVDPPLRFVSLLGRVHWIHTLFLLDQPERALLELERCAGMEASRTPIAWPELVLLRGLAAARRVQSVARRDRRPLRRQLRRLSRWMHARAEHAPHCMPLAAMLDAELARVTSALPVALGQYVRAAQIASDHQLPQHAGLMQERRGSLLLEHRRSFEAIQCLQEALDQYEKWGARAKVALLRATLSQLQGRDRVLRDPAARR